MLSLDGKVTTLLLNSTVNGSADGPTPVFHASQPEIGDHQLYGKVKSREDNGVIYVNHFGSPPLQPDRHTMSGARLIRLDQGLCCLIV